MVENSEILRFPSRINKQHPEIAPGFGMCKIINRKHERNETLIFPQLSSGWVEMYEMMVEEQQFSSSWRHSNENCLGKRPTKQPLDVVSSNTTCVKLIQLQNFGKRETILVTRDFHLFSVLFFYKALLATMIEKLSLFLKYIFFLSFEINLSGRKI